MMVEKWWIGRRAGDATVYVNQSVINQSVTLGERDTYDPAALSNSISLRIPLINRYSYEIRDRHCSCPARAHVCRFRFKRIFQISRADAGDAWPGRRVHDRAHEYRLHACDRDPANSRRTLPAPRRAFRSPGPDASRTGDREYRAFPPFPRTDRPSHRARDLGNGTLPPLDLPLQVPCDISTLTGWLSVTS